MYGRPFDLALHLLSPVLPSCPGAGRIGRAWRRFLASPGRLRAVAAATRIQALWRGWASRRRTAAQLLLLRRRRALRADLYAAVSAGDLAAARLAAEQLADLNAGPEAARLVAQLEQQAAESEAALRATAACGGADVYQAAAADSRRYTHLAEARSEAARQFASRVAAAEEAVEKAALGATVRQFREAAAAAAALGVSPAWLARAEESVMRRQQEVAAALAAALAAAPFDRATFQQALERARLRGLHADAARAQRGLQLHRHRAAAALQQLAAEGEAAELEAACQEAGQLGLDAEAHSALCMLGQRREAAAEQLRQASLHGSLQEYQVADAAATALQVDASLRQSCREQVGQRQHDAEQQLLMAASGQSDVAAMRRLCQSAARLGLHTAVAEAEQAVQRRRTESVQQLLRSTQQACDCASAAAQAAEQGPQGATEYQGCPQDAATHVQLLGGWLAAVQQLATDIEERGEHDAFAHPRAACRSWPAELCRWLADARQAASLELGSQVLAATLAFQAHLAALHTTALASRAVVQLERRQAAAGRTGTSSSRPSSRASPRPGCSAAESPWGCAKENVDGAANLLRETQQLRTDAQSARPTALEEDLLQRFSEWRATQQDLLPLVAAAAQRAAQRAAPVVELAGEASGGRHGLTRLDLSCQGLAGVELLSGATHVEHLDIRSNSLAR